MATLFMVISIQGFTIAGLDLAKTAPIVLSLGVLSNALLDSAI